MNPMSDPRPVTALALESDAPLDPEMQAYFDKCREKLGLVPNVLTAFRHRPDRLRAFVETYNSLMLGPSGLSKLEREAIAVTVSAANRCYYCLVAHGQAVRQLSGNPAFGEQLVMNYRAADLDDRMRAMLDYAWALTLTPMDVGPADRDRLRSVGFQDADIFDIAEIAAFFNYTNRLAHAVEMEPNPEYHGLNR